MPEHKPITILDELPLDGRYRDPERLAALRAAADANPGKWVLAYESVKQAGGNHVTWNRRGYKVAARKNPDGTVNVYVSKPLATGGE